MTDKAMEAAARAVDALAERPMAKPTIHELEKILAEPAGNVKIRPDGSIVVDGKSNSTEVAQAAVTAWLAALDGETAMLMLFAKLVEAGTGEAEIERLRARARELGLIGKAGG